MLRWKKTGRCGVLPTSAGLVLVLYATWADAQSVVIRNAIIFDGTGADPYAGSVLVKAGRITEIAKRVTAPRGAELIDANGMALLPGLVDIHTHWTPAGEPDTFPAIATRYVRHGVTTVNDFHAAPESYQPKRAWLQTMTAPHVNYAARISTPGGHGAIWGDKKHYTPDIDAGGRTPHDSATAPLPAGYD